MTCAECELSDTLRRLQLIAFEINYHAARLGLDMKDTDTIDAIATCGLALDERMIGAA